MVVYGEPQISENALFVPAGQITDLEPGAEIHWHQINEEDYHDEL